ncbi:hypothetical protein [Prosthecomicrobium pneumaticum]|uniref:Uncharacterized protein n=1 Tax=Prosthecomicrobium pneumaticum TaxID=81895 RepID=A0A7W9FPG5_9HYPH|nr:hypothetical protein [Prosthecomicrobium pneumaticum]MBB5754380.1 hypothetical protein [Prosthecomicrobium pneumaticum]
MQSTRLVYAVVDGIPVKGFYWVDEAGTVTVRCERGDATGCPLDGAAADLAHTLLVRIASEPPRPMEGADVPN